MSRRRLLALVVLPTLLLGLGLGGLLLVDAGNRQAEVREADEAAATHVAALADFRSATAAALEDVDLGDPERVGEVVQQQAEGLPELADVSEHGAATSTAYQDARQLGARTREDVAALLEVTEAGAESRRFVLAANRALDVDPRDLLTATTVPDGSPVRAQLLPQMRATLEELRAVEVPEGADEAATSAQGALEYVIREAETLAAELDAGRGYRFEFGEQYFTARQAVRQHAEDVRAEVREAVDRVVGDPAVA